MRVEVSRTGDTTWDTEKQRHGIIGDGAQADTINNSEMVKEV